jgi:hypothetical protein
MIDEQQRETKAGGKPEMLEPWQPPITPIVERPKREHEVHRHCPIQKGSHYRSSPERHFKPQAAFR